MQLHLLWDSVVHGPVAGSGSVIYSCLMPAVTERMGARSLKSRCEYNTKYGQLGFSTIIIHHIHSPLPRSNHWEGVWMIPLHPMMTIPLCPMMTSHHLPMIPTEANHLLRDMKEAWRHFLEEKCSWIDLEMINMGSSNKRTFTFLGHQGRSGALPPSSYVPAWAWQWLMTYSHSKL